MHGTNMKKEAEIFARLEVVTAEIMKVQVFWDVTVYGLVYIGLQLPTF